MESSGGQNSLEQQSMSSNEEAVEFAGDNDYYNFEINSLSRLPFVKTSQSIQWKNKVNLVGEKIINPKIHICDDCNKPILVYGRMVSILNIEKCSKMLFTFRYPASMYSVMNVPKNIKTNVYVVRKRL